MSLQTLGVGTSSYPKNLIRRMGPDGIFDLVVSGAEPWSEGDWVGVLSSRRVPAELLLPSLDCARRLCAEGLRMIGGFHAPLEREFLRIVGADAKVEITIATIQSRGTSESRGSYLPSSTSLHPDTRVWTIGPLRERWSRLTTEAAAERNRLVAAMSHSLIILYADPGSATHRLAREALEWGVTVKTLDHPSNQHLLLLGATALQKSI